MLNVHIVIADAIFDVSGEVPFSDVRALIDEWFHAIEPPDLDALTRAVDAQAAKAHALKAAQEATT